MSKHSSASKIKMSNFDELFGMNDSINESAEVLNVPVNDLYEFKGHPFKIRDDEKMEELADSIRQHGVLVPGIARLRPQGGYEIISGHSRRQACVLAGLDTIPMFIKNLSDDEAVIVMVDSNIQRESILPSEKAKAYKMKYDAIKHQGVKGNSLVEMSMESGESAKTVQRYIWLARLSDSLLEMVDEKKIGFSQGIELSLLNDQEQKMLLEYLEKNGAKMTIQQAREIKEKSREGRLDKEALCNIFSPVESISYKRYITLKPDRLNDYFPDNYSKEEIEKVIISLLEKWKQEAMKLPNE